MTAFATWLFIGLVLPQLGVERAALRSERFLRMDEGVHAHPSDDWYVQLEKKAGGNPNPASVVVSSGYVSAAIIFAGGTIKRDLDERTERDFRCARRQWGGFKCQLEGPLGDVNVVSCSEFVVIYPDAVPEDGPARRPALCTGSAEGRFRKACELKMRASHLWL